MLRTNGRRFVGRNAKRAHAPLDCIAEFLEARAYLSTVTFPTTPAEYELGGSIETGNFVDSYPAVAAFTSSGLPDVATANNSISGQDGSVSVLINQGNGTFGTATNLPAGERPFQVIAGVFTSSGDEDLVVTNSEDGTVGFYAGNGSGGFAAPILSTYGNPAPSGSGALAYLAAVKLTTGGNLDLVIADQSDNELVTMTGDGAGHFTVDQTIPGIFDSIVTGQFLDDGNDDVATTSSNGNVIDIFKNNGDGTLDTTPVQLDTNALGGSQGAGLVTGDFTGNGRADLALLTASSTSDSAPLTVFLNEGNGTFSAPITTVFQDADDLAVGDFTGSGTLDVVTTDGSNLDVYLGNGDGTFQTTPAFSDNTGVNGGPDAADLNDDGKADIFFATSPESLQKFPSGNVLAVFINGQSGGGGGGGGGGGASATLTPTISGKLPKSVIAGQKAPISETVTITDSGAAYDASATTQLFLSTGTTIDDSSIALPAKLTRIEKLKVGAHTSFKLSLSSLPGSVPDGTYHVLAQVTDDKGNTTVAASSGTITVAPAQIDLSVTIAKFVSSAKGGKKFTETIRVANDGNSPAVGSLPILVDASPDDSLDVVTQLLATSKGINLKPDKSITIPLSLTAPASGSSDFLIFRIDPNDKFHDINLANNTVFSPTKVTFS